MSFRVDALVFEFGEQRVLALMFPTPAKHEVTREEADAYAAEYQRAHPNARCHVSETPDLPAPAKPDAGPVVKPVVPSPLAAVAPPGR
jgi:hypothetical protein